MKKIAFFTKIIFLLSVTGIISCQNPEISIPFGIDNNSVQLGADQSGKFVLNNNKIFTAKDKIIIKFKAMGLTIKQGKIKTNVDIFLKKDKDVLGTQTDILGTDGLSQAISGIGSDYSGNNGKTDVELSIIPPSDTNGEIVANITLKDLNSPGKLATFETKFTLK
jgi:hypothetical protein